MHDLLAYVYLPKPLEYSQEGNVEPLPGDLIIPGGMTPAVANVMNTLKTQLYFRSKAPWDACIEQPHVTTPLMWADSVLMSDMQDTANKPDGNSGLPSQPCCSHTISRSLLMHTAEALTKSMFLRILYLSSTAPDSQ